MAHASEADMPRASQLMRKFIRQRYKRAYCKCNFVAKVLFLLGKAAKRTSVCNFAVGGFDRI